MSTFCGRMREYREISIDRFDRENLQSTVFILSHCHRDHMVGLNLQSFLNRLKTNNNIYLYVSDVSKVLLMGDNTYNFKDLEPFIRVLEKGENTITIPCNTPDGKPKFVSVTPLPAGHCPGSVMLLFEGSEGTVLYTGDFRWETNHAASMPALQNELGVKPIKSLYIDTTFCNPNAFHFPSRAQCVEVTVQLVEDWLKRSSSHFVYIASPTNYGHEHLQVQIHKHTKHQIHASSWKYNMYSQIQDLAEAYTIDPNTRIHACGLKRKYMSKSRLPCGHIFDTEDEELKLLVIRPSTMWFTMSTDRSEKLVEEPSNIYQPHRVCYSFHSSFSEIKDLVSYLNPDQVFPNVIPAQEPDGQMVQARLNSFLRKKDNLVELDSHRPLGNLKRKLTTTIMKSCSLSDGEELVFDSPIKSKKPKPDAMRPDTPEKLPTPDFSSLADFQASQLISPAKSLASNPDSSYHDSHDSGSEMDLCATPSKESQETQGFPEQTIVTPLSIELKDDEIISSWQDSEVLRLYISDDEDDDDKDIGADEPSVCVNKVNTLINETHVPEDLNKQIDLSSGDSANHASLVIKDVKSSECANHDELVTKTTEDLLDSLNADPLFVSPREAANEASRDESGDIPIENVKSPKCAAVDKQFNLSSCKSADDISITGKNTIIGNKTSEMTKHKLTHSVSEGYKTDLDDLLQTRISTIMKKTSKSSDNEHFLLEPNELTEAFSISSKSIFTKQDDCVEFIKETKVETVSVNNKSNENVLEGDDQGDQGDELIDEDVCENIPSMCTSVKITNTNKDTESIPNLTVTNTVINDNRLSNQGPDINDIIILDDDSNQSNELILSCDEGTETGNSAESCDRVNQSVLSLKSCGHDRSLSRSPSILKMQSTPSKHNSTQFDSDSDATLPPSQKSLSRYGNFNDQSDSDSSDVEILFEESQVNDFQVRSRSFSPRSHPQRNGFSSDDDVIDLTDDSQRY